MRFNVLRKSCLTALAVKRLFSVNTAYYVNTSFHNPPKARKRTSQPTFLSLLMIFAYNRCGFRAYLSKRRAKARISSFSRSASGESADFEPISYHHQAKARKTTSQPTFFSSVPIYTYNRLGFRAYLSKHRAKARIPSLFHIHHLARARKTASQPTNTSLDKVLAYLGRHSSLYANYQETSELIVSVCCGSPKVAFCYHTASFFESSIHFQNK